MKCRFFLQMRQFWLLMILLISLDGLSQSNHIANAPKTSPPTNSAAARVQQIRMSCINGRRSICGRVLQVTHSGIVVDSGYTSLMKPPFNHSWVVSGTVSATRPANLLETSVPDSPCVGLVFLTDIPKRPAVHQYDFVVIHGFPAGNYDYKPVPGISKNIRRFSAGLERAIQLNLQANED